MAENFTGTIPLPENPALANLRDRETALKTELDRLEKMDANKMQQGGHDFMEVKRRTQIQLVEIRKAIQEATK